MSKIYMNVFPIFTGKNFELRSKELSISFFIHFSNENQ